MPEPTETISVEEPWMRHAAWMFATGNLATAQIAKALDKPKKLLDELLKQFWFQERVTKLIDECSGANNILALFRAEEINCLVTMKELRDNPKVAAATRAAICMNMLDRTMGKPVVHVESKNTTISSSTTVEEIERLEREIRLLHEQNMKQVQAFEVVAETA